MTIKIVLPLMFTSYIFTIKKKSLAHHLFLTPSNWTSFQLNYDHLGTFNIKRRLIGTSSMLMGYLFVTIFWGVIFLFFL